VLIGTRGPVAFLVAALLAFPAACGGSEPEGRPAAGWMQDVCAAIGTWLEDIETRTQELDRASASITTLEQGRDLFVDYIDDLAASTDDAAQEIAAARQPAVMRGGEISSGLRRTMGDIGDILVETREDARNLRVDDPARFEQQIAKLGASTGRRIAAAGEDFADRFRGEAPGELQDAFREEPACEPLA
jgi:hypothetical protein